MGLDRYWSDGRIHQEVDLTAEYLKLSADTESCTNLPCTLLLRLDYKMIEVLYIVIGEQKREFILWFIEWVSGSNL